MSGRCGILGLGKGRSAALDRETERRRALAVESGGGVTSLRGSRRSRH